MKVRAGIVGATGMVGQRFITLLENHPYFEVTCLAASSRSAGKTYKEAMGDRWKLAVPMPEYAADMPVYDAEDISSVAAQCDFVFCAVDMKGSAMTVRELEEAYAKAEIPVVSNNSANRHTPDVPMIIPEINPDHLSVIDAQRRRLGTKHGFIVVKPNCSIQTYVPALTPLYDCGIEQICVSTYQAVSGAGKTLDTFPGISDNVIPYIGGEEEKSEREPLKIWGSVVNGEIVPAVAPVISAQCVRVPVSDGHLATVSVKFTAPPTRDEILSRWNAAVFEPQKLGLPSAPEKFITYFDEPDRPQPVLDRDIYGGMGVCVGRLREDPIFDYKFVCLSHNTLRGAAGGGLETAELLYARGLLSK